MEGVNKSDRERHTLYVWNLKNIANLYIEPKKCNELVPKTSKKQIHRYREKTSAYHWGEEMRRDNIGVGGNTRVIIGLCQIMHMKLVNILKHYRI